MFICSCIGRGS